mgnify:CR=1 FL=1
MNFSKNPCEYLFLAKSDRTFMYDQTRRMNVILHITQRQKWDEAKLTCAYHGDTLDSARIYSLFYTATSYPGDK